MLLEKDHRYILKEVSYTQHSPLREFLVLEVTEKFYKVKNLIADFESWISKDKIKDSDWGLDGYFVEEDLGKMVSYKEKMTKKVLKAK